nr:putative reverse transcriptase, RNA-dependent DNA polymerase [Tanacetum cinerariifolium]
SAKVVCLFGFGVWIREYHVFIYNNHVPDMISEVSSSQKNNLDNPQPDNLDNPQRDNLDENNADDIQDSTFEILQEHEEEVTRKGAKYQMANIAKGNLSNNIKAFAKKYILDLLAEIGMINCKPADTPMMVNLLIEKKAKLADRNRYQWLVGKLIYLSHTRPDIAHAVGVVSRFMHQPQVAHMNAALRIVRGFIYQNKDKKNILMRIDELHKFSDGTLNDVRNALDDCLKGIRMQCLPSTIWRKGDKDRAAAMIQAIEKMMKTRRIMRSLEKFVGGRLYEGDLRMLQRTI